MKGRDDDFFKLPKAKNPLRRVAPDADKPASTAAADPVPAPSPSPSPKVSHEPAPSAAAKPARVEPTPAPPRAASTPTPAASPPSATPPPAAPAPKAVSERDAEPVLARNPLRRDPAPAERAAASKPTGAASGKPSGAAPPPPPLPPKSGSRRYWLWPVLGIGVIGIVIVGGLIGYWAFMNVAARLVLADQPLTIRLPEQENVTLRTDYKIDVLMKGVINAQVPLVQTLDLPIDGTYDTIIDLDTQVPLETVITYEGVIPVDSMADIEAKAPVNFQNVKKYKNLHFKAKLPLKMNLPVKLVVPVKQVIPLKYKGPLRVTIKHVIKAPVGTTLNTALKVDQQFSVPVTSSLPLRATLPQHPVKATIVNADLNLDLSTLRLEKKPKDAP